MQRDLNLDYEKIEEDFNIHMEKNKHKKWSMYTNFEKYDESLFWTYIYKLLIINYEYNYMNFDEFRSGYNDTDDNMVFVKKCTNIFSKNSKKFYFEGSSSLLDDIQIGNCSKKYGFLKYIHDLKDEIETNSDCIKLMLIHNQ